MPDEMSDEMMADRIRALLVEKRDHPERAGSVDAELARLGYQAAPPAKRSAKRVQSTGAKRG
jgi:hypothetical protein